MRLYRGIVGDDGTKIILKVTVDRGLGAFGDARPLDPRFDLVNHSPTGFEWGYGGSGPSQAALAILADAIEDDAMAVLLHQQFKWRVVANLAQEQDWLISQSMVRAICKVELRRALADRAALGVWTP